MEPTRQRSVCVGIKRIEASEPMVSHIYITLHNPCHPLHSSLSSPHHRPRLHEAGAGRLPHSRRRPVDGRPATAADACAPLRHETPAIFSPPTIPIAVVCLYCLCLFLCRSLSEELSRSTLCAQSLLCAHCAILLVVSPLSLKGARRLSQSRLDH